MPKVKYVKARKDYPSAGVVKGDMCYVWSLRAGPWTSGTAYRQKTPPKPWQLTTSEFLQGQLRLQDQIENLDKDSFTSDDVSSIIDEIRALGEEQREKYDNLPEGFQQGSTGEFLEERADQCEEWVSSLEGVDVPDHIEEPTEPERDAEDSLKVEYEESWEVYREYKESLGSAYEEIQACEYQGS